MTARTTGDDHVQPPTDIHTMLQEEVKATGEPATARIREALCAWLRQRRKDRLFAELQAFAIAHAGTEFDRDEELLAASMEALAEEAWPDVEARP